jgi:dienelactone hydrolase
MLVEDSPAVVVLHGSGGMDTRNAFYGQSLQRRFTTLSVEMFKGSVSAGTDRPPLPLFNYSYALGALKYLIEAEGFIAEDGTIGGEAGADLNRKVPVDPDTVGCLGLSWGGVICNQLAVEKYSQAFGDSLYGTNYRFAAHAANYPVCWARNLDSIPGLPPGADGGLDFGRNFGAELTGAPVLIQVGSEDAYDNSGIPGDPLESGSLPCNALKASLDADEQKLFDVVVFDGGYHAFDRLFAVAAVAKDQFARLGIAFLSDDPNHPDNWPEVAVIPDQVIANESSKNILRFFRRNLRY